MARLFINELLIRKLLIEFTFYEVPDQLQAAALSAAWAGDDLMLGYRVDFT
jgi:hypothetical protein